MQQKPGPSKIWQEEKEAKGEQGPARTTRKQPEVGNVDFKIQPNKVENVVCFLLFLAPFNCSYHWNQLTNFSVCLFVCCFFAKCSCEKVHTVRKMKTEFDRLSLSLLDQTTYVVLGGDIRRFAGGYVNRLTVEGA